MRQRENRKVLLFIVAASVIASVVLLGVLQYIWVNRASEAEEARLMRSLRTSTDQVLSLSREESRVLLAFLYLTPEEYEQKDWSRFASSLRFWSANTRFPRLLESVYLISAAKPEVDQGFFSYSFEAETFQPIPPPENFEGLVGGDPRDPDLPRLSEKVQPLSHQGIVVQRMMFHNLPKKEVPSSSGEILAHEVLAAIQFDLDVLYREVIPYYMNAHLEEYPFRIIDTKTNQSIFSTEDLPPSWRPELSIPLRGALLFPWSYFSEARAVEPAESSPSALLENYLELDPSVRLWLQSSRAFNREVFRAPETEQTPVALLEVFYPDRSLHALISIRRLVNLLVSIGILLLLVAFMVMLYRLYENTMKMRAQEQEFVTSMSHELRTPIAVLQSTSENLKQGLITDNSRIGQYSSVIYKESRRLSRMVEGFLLYSGLENRQRRNNRLVKVDLKELVEVITESLREPARERHATIAVSLPPSATTIHSDPSAVRLILENLLMNAIRYGLPADRSSEAPAEIRLKLKRRILSHALEIAVEDDGAGIPHKDAKRVFEPFFRGDASIRGQQPGSGLGLHLVRRITKILGGTIHLESPYLNVVGKTQSGSRFVVELPDKKVGTR